MAIDTTGGNANMDYPAHVATYKGFLRLVQIVIVFLVVLLTSMYVFLV